MNVIKTTLNRVQNEWICSFEVIKNVGRMWLMWNWTGFRVHNYLEAALGTSSSCSSSVVRMWWVFRLTALPVSALCL